MQKNETKNLQKILKSLPKTRKSKIRKLKTEIKKSNKRGSPTRGWSSASPQKGKERQELFNRCGSKCFLLPQSLGYPVCDSLRLNKTCKFNCSGILAAKIRANQFHKRSVAKSAKKLEKKYCVKKSDSRKSSKRRVKKSIRRV